MDTFRSMTFLRRVLLIDAVSSAFMGAALLTLSGLFASLCNLPETLLVESGYALVPFAAFVGYLATRSTPPRSAASTSPPPRSWGGPGWSSSSAPTSTCRFRGRSPVQWSGDRAADS